MSNFKSSTYWDNRYKKNKKGSGWGSYGQWANFKAEVLNDFVKEYNIQSVIELGSGDGNQTSLFKFPNYIGTDISPTIVEKCTKMFENDNNKSFFVHNTKNLKDLSCGEYDLVLSLDVIYHLVEDNVFNNYINWLTKLAKKYLIIYASNQIVEGTSEHVKHRVFTEHEKFKDFKLLEVIKNKYPERYFKNVKVDFYIFERVNE